MLAMKKTFWVKSPAPSGRDGKDSMSDLLPADVDSTEREYITGLIWNKTASYVFVDILNLRSF